MHLGLVIISIALTVVILWIICGNGLVIIAVLISPKLRQTPTNVFIASLASADMSLALLVLPFSGTRQVLSYWIFGDLWCTVWLALDVLLCTASILNLCAISVDRFLAISRPISYPRIITSSRGRYIIVFVWLLATTISFPPLFGWTDRKSIVETLDLASTPKPKQETTAEIIVQMEGQPNWTRLFNYTFLNDVLGLNITTNAPSLNQQSNEPQCDLVRDQGYVIYSALGSFYIPCSMLLFFYTRIFIVARQTAKSLQTGIVNTQAGECSTGLRIHRGGTKVFKSDDMQEGMSLLTPKTIPRQLRSNSIGNIETDERMETSLNNDIGSPKHKIGAYKRNTPVSASNRMIVPRKSVHFSTSPLRENSSDTFLSPTEPTERNLTLHVNSVSANSIPTLGKPRSSFDNRATPVKDARRFSIVQFAKRTYEQGRFQHEAKAARTLSLVVGGFIICWAPFFTVYLLGAFNVGPPGKTAFDFIFWLGYCNSALNPCIYAAFSRDYRAAFKEVLSCGRSVRRETRKRTMQMLENARRLGIKRPSCSYDVTPPS